MELFRDVAYSWRRLRRTPGFFAVAILTLALGIGANTALFSLVNGILFRSIPVANLERVVYLTRIQRSTGRDFLSIADAQVRAVAGSGLFDDIVLTDPLIGALTGNAQSDVVTGEVVSGNYFGVFGVVPRLGRLLQPSDDTERGEDVPIVISDRLWRRAFAADPAVVGRPVTMAGQPLVIVGVAPAGFKGTWLPTILTADIWAPIRAQSRLRTVQGAVAVTSHRVFATLHSGVTLQQANAAVAAAGAGAADAGPSTSLVAEPARRGMILSEFDYYGRLAGSLLLALSALVFLIASANLTNLLLARGVSRTAEVAIRLAIGASRSRIARLLMAETALLAAVGGAVGLGLAFGLTSLMATLPLPSVEGIGISFDPSPDLRVFGYALALAGVGAITIGLWPARHAARADPVRVLVAGGASGATSRAGRTRVWLVAAQLAMSMTLLVLGGLYARSAIRAVQFDPGYDMSHVAAASVDLSMAKVEESKGRRLLSGLLNAARRMPGVSNAALSSVVPASLVGRYAAVGIAGPSANRNVDAGYTAISPGFFPTLGLPLRRGRDFSDIDGPRAPHVVIISEALAARVWPGRDAIGQSLTVDAGAGGRSAAPAPIEAQVVGIVAGMQRSAGGGAATTGRPSSSADLHVYVPAAQAYSPTMSLLARTAADPRAILDQLRRSLHGVDRDVALVTVAPVSDIVGLRFVPIRITALVLGVLGVLGFGIAMIGVYGVMAFAVSQRTREFGIHRALGASSRQIHAAVLRQGARMLLAGLIPGVVISILAASLLRHLLYGIEPYDPPTLVMAPLVLLLAGLAASYVPARRAARVEPGVALREP